MADPQVTIISNNRRARHEYHILDRIEVGIVLRGTEVKSVRNGKVNLQESYAAIENGELFLHGMHISPFEKGSIHNHDPVRVRKLLARRREIVKLAEKSQEKGLTLIPLQLYFLGRYLKIELGICRGKKFYDKRHDLKKRDASREIQRQLRDDRS